MSGLRHDGVFGPNTHPVTDCDRGENGRAELRRLSWRGCFCQGGGCRLVHRDHRRNAGRCGCICAGRGGRDRQRRRRTGHRASTVTRVLLVRAVGVMRIPGLDWTVVVHRIAGAVRMRPVGRRASRSRCANRHFRAAKRGGLGPAKRCKNQDSDESRHTGKASRRARIRQTRMET
jgi:hypothetical protein